jgi:hypothetical protein
MATLKARRKVHKVGPPTSYWHPRHDLPAKPPNLSLDARAALKKAVSDNYVQNQGRGQYSDLDVHLRHDTVHYFMMYLSDYPDTFVGYNDDGALDRHPQTPAFDVVFRYDESCGHLDLYAEGPQQLLLVKDSVRMLAYCLV